MNSKLLLKWACIALMCAALFGSIGYMYGSIIATEKCNEFWDAKDPICNTLIIPTEQTISTDNGPVSIDESKSNFTPEDIK